MTTLIQQRLPDRRASRLAWAAAFGLVAACGDSGTEAAPAVTVTVEPAETLIVGEGASVTFSAVALDAQGARVQSAPAWSVADPSVASIDARGIAVSTRNGTTTVTAIVDGVRGNARLEVFVPEKVDRYEPGQSYYGRRNYVEYIPGELPLILSASHGGALRPRETPDRTWGVTLADRNTVELTLAMRDSIAAQTGMAPHIVISHLHRSKLDPNREVDEAAQGNLYAGRAWQEFHDWIRVARSTVWGEFGEGLYLDIHGHGHDIDRLELGYLLTAQTLNQPDAALNNLTVVRCSSIRELGRDSAIPFSQLLRGATSFGGLLQDEGVRSVPSPADPSPGTAPYFRGGYNTRQHGSQEDGEVISGIQIEHHFPGLRDTDENRRRYAGKAARVIRRFMIEHFGFFEPGAQGAQHVGAQTEGCN